MVNGKQKHAKLYINNCLFVCLVMKLDRTRLQRLGAFK